MSILALPGPFFRDNPPLAKALSALAAELIRARYADPIVYDAATNRLFVVLSDRLLGGLVVQNDAPATATHILTHKSSFRLGIAMGLVDTDFYVALIALFYDLFKP